MMKNCEVFEVPRKTRYASFARSGGLPTNRFPQTEEEANRADSLLAKSFEKLSVEDREKVLHDIHAVTELSGEEHPKLVEQKLSQLERELNEIMKTGDYAYAHVVVESNKYVKSRSFHWMFLCKEKYDVKLAAMAILQHFEVKRKWFGQGEVLTRPVYQSDLTEEERMILEMGFMRLWSDKDSSGRTILSFEDRQMTGIPFPYGHRHCRVMWYMMMKALEDQDTTRARGVIFVVPIPSDDPDKLSIDQANDFNEIKSVIPVAIVAQHICYQHCWQRPYLTGIKIFTNEVERFRMQIHHGCKDNIEKKLQTFGIPTQHLLWTKESAPRHIKVHQEWLNEQREFETSQHAESIPMNEQLGYTKKQAVEADGGGERTEEIKPNRFDVLFGRTTFTRGHTGTVRAMHIVQMNYDAYEKLGRYQKMDMAEKIVRDIQRSGGRFLRQNEDDLWFEVDDAEARKKIAHWFRRRREDLQYKKKNQTGFKDDTTRRTRRNRLVPANP